MILQKKYYTLLLSRKAGGSTAHHTIPPGFREEWEAGRRGTSKTSDIFYGLFRCLRRYAQMDSRMERIAAMVYAVGSDSPKPTGPPLAGDVQRM